MKCGESLSLNPNPSHPFIYPRIGCLNCWLRFSRLIVQLSVAFGTTWLWGFSFLSFVTTIPLKYETPTWASVRKNDLLQWLISLDTWNPFYFPVPSKKISCIVNFIKYLRGTVWTPAHIYYNYSSFPQSQTNWKKSYACREFKGILLLTSMLTCVFLSFPQF